VVLTGEGADELFAGYHHLRELDEESLRDALVDGVSAREDWASSITTKSPEEENAVGA